MDNNRKDPPIEPLDYMQGVKVVDIGDIRVARGMSRRPASSCSHRQLRYDRQERRIWCADCEQDVEPFDAFRETVEQFSNAASRLAERDAKIKEAEEHSLRSIAAKEMDKAWRSRTMLPACPHCSRGISPEDVKRGLAKVGRDYEMKRREAEKGSKP